MEILPSEVNSSPCRAARVGSTQSIMSTPIPAYCAISSGVPTPIKYRGLSAGRCWTVASATSRVTSRGSPTLNPPMAYPGKSISTVRSADRIYVLSSGRVAESGTHEELIAADGIYAELFSLQALPYQ